MNDFFDKILNSLKSFFSSSSQENRVLGIDIGTSSIKLVQLREKKGRAVLETYGVVYLGPYQNLEVGQVVNLSVAQVAQALNDLLKNSGATTNRAGISLSSTSSLVFVLDLPAQITENEISTVVPLEAKKYIPVPMNEISLDYFLIPSKPYLNQEETLERSEDKKEVLVVAVHNDILNKYKEIIKQTKLETDFFEVEIFSNINSVWGRDLTPVLIMDIGASKTKLSIVEYGIIRSFHIINRGSFDITKSLSSSLSINFLEAEKKKIDIGLIGNGEDKKISEIIDGSLDYIFSETNNIILSYENKNNRAISKVILTGGGSLLKGFLDKAKENFRTEVIYGEPFEKVESPEFLKRVLENIGPEFSIALGLALKKIK